jgi:hypothetical protein
MCASGNWRQPVKLEEYFKMKEGSIQVTTLYVGANWKNNVLPNGVVAWGNLNMAPLMSFI